MANLSPNVKKYFVNALKGIGVLIPDKEGNLHEQTESSLQNPELKLLDIYDAIAIAVVGRVGDHKHFPALAETTKFDRQTIKGMMAKGIGIDNNVSEDFAFKLTTGKGLNNDIVVQKVIDTLLKGVINQKITINGKTKRLTPDEVKDIQKIWNQIRCAKFENYLSKYPNKYNKEEFEKWIIDNENAEYNHLKRQYDLDQAEEYLRIEFKTYYNGDEQAAKDFLSKGIQDETLNYLKTNGHLMKNSVDECLRRLKIRNQISPQLKEALAEVEDKGFSSTFNVLAQNGFLTMQDVCLAAGNTKEQIAIFFQNRSMEQKEQEKEKQESEKDNKKDKSKTENIGETLIGNLMGASGRKYVKHITGKKAAVRYNWKFFKLGKKGPWRGYKAIFDRINSHLGTIYGNLQAIGFSQTFVERMTGYKFLPMDTSIKPVEENEDDQEKGKKKTPKESWETGYQPLIDEYKTDGKLNKAGEFYNKTKARILADKVRIHELNAKISDGCSENDEKKYTAQINYLQQRIAEGEKVLSTLEQQIKATPDADNLKDEKYFKKLEEQIVTPKKEQEKENKQDDYLQNIADDVSAIKDEVVGVDDKEREEQKKKQKNKIEDKRLTDGAIKELVNSDKKHSANDEIAYALDVFKKAMQNNSFGQQKARIEIAADVFNIRDKFTAGEIEGGHLQGLTGRFINNKSFERMLDDISKNQTTVDVVMTKINQFVENDLQNYAMRDQYNQHKIEEYRKEITKAAIDERQM